MTKENILNDQITKSKRVVEGLLKRSVAYHPMVAKALESVKAAILWDQLNYWDEKTTDPNRWVYKTQEELYDETGLSRKEQETARKICIEAGVLEEKKAGIPPKMNFRVNMDAMIKLLSQFSNKKKETTSEPFVWDDELQKLFDSPRPDLNIIGMFFEQKELSFSNKGELNSAIRRHLRSAKALEPFDNTKIESAIKVAKKEYKELWTLETLLKILTR